MNKFSLQWAGLKVQQAGVTMASKAYSDLLQLDDEQKYEVLVQLLNTLSVSWTWKASFVRDLASEWLGHTK